MRTYENRIQIFLSVLVLLLAFFSVSIFRPNFVKAESCRAGDTLCREKHKENDCRAVNIDASNCGIVQLLDTVFNLVSGAISLAIIGNIIYAGIQYSIAQGDPSKASKSKDRIRNAVIAFLMYISLYAFIQWLIPGGVF